MKENSHQSARWLFIALGASGACSTAASPDQRDTGANQRTDGGGNGGTGAVASGGGGTAGGLAGSGGTPGGGSGGSKYQPDARASDAGTGGGLVCGESVSDYCARATGSCIMSWPTDVTAFCPPAPRSGFTAWSERCGSYRRARIISNVDVGGNYYYDIASGQLVAIVAHYYSGGEARCDAGPARFVEPRTCNESVQICFDVGSGGAGSGGQGADGSSGSDAGRQDGAR